MPKYGSLKHQPDEEDEAPDSVSLGLSVIALLVNLERACHAAHGQNATIADPAPFRKQCVLTAGCRPARA